MLYVKLMWCSGLPWIYGQLEEGVVSVSWNLFGVVVLHGSMVNWRRGCQSVMKIGVVVFQRSMLNWQGVHQPEVFSIMVFHGSMVNWRREGWGQSVMKTVWCNGLPEIHAWLTGGPSARSIQCNGLPWIYGQLEEGGPGSCISCCCSCCSSAIVDPQLQMNNKNIIQQQQQQHTDTCT